MRSWDLLVTGLVAGTALLAADPPVKFNRDIRPIMSDTCFRCHGPDKRSRMAGLRLDIRQEALKPTRTGVTPIVPGDPEKSAIVQRVFATNAKIMPPAFAHKELTAAQKDTIRRWVAQGAVYEGHWAYQPVTRPAVPRIDDPKAPIRNPIDAFIQERLAREGLTPSPEADRRTLLRRVSLDLTGLPPTPAELEAFQSDSSPDAYEKVVDRLLATPAYAEMRTMRWLDAVRYADSAGFHGDNLWPVWPYRDCVLRAFRENMPFDQFTREQIAGDLIPNATRDQLVASAFNRLNRASAEGGIQPKEYIAKYGADRVRTVSTVWLGSTMGCAECHDHRFDPFASKDFYSMKAFFADIGETGLIQDRGRNAWGSKLMLASEEQSERLKEFDAQIETVRSDLMKRAAASREQRWQWEERTLAAHKSGDLAWKYQRPLAASSVNGAKLTIYNDELVDSNYYLNGSLASEKKRGDGLIIVSGPNPDNETYNVQFKPGAGAWTALGIDIFQDESLPGNRLSRGADRFVLTEVEAGQIVAQTSAGVAQASAWVRKIPFILATSTGFGQPPEHPAMAAIDGDPRTGWGVAFGEHRNAFLALRFKQKVTTTPEDVIVLRLHHDSEFRRATIGRFRVALSSAEHSFPETGDSGSKHKQAESAQDGTATLSIATDRGLPPDVLQALERDEPDRNETQKKLVLEHYAWAAPQFETLTVRLAQLEAERDQFEAAIPRVIYTERAKPRVTRVLARGNFLDDSGEIVQPAIPGFLGKLDTPGRRATRLDLADWLVSTRNPLTARTQVNRMWRELFGTGLSKILEDLGSQGEWPTHPELLDWLAAELMQPEAPGAHAWDTKNLMRTIVLSHTYRQASMPTPAMEERDPDNRLLARQSRYRVDAEVVHDIALTVAGLRVDAFGGPSVRPYEPAGYLAGLNFPKREYSPSHGGDLYRRALYTEWQRTFLHPSLSAFDAPTREECTVNRVSSNTPLQALVLLNDPIFVEAARAFAERIVTNAKTFDSQLDWAFLNALNRKPSPEERNILASLYKKNVARFKSGEADPAKLLAVGESPLPASVDKTDLAAMTTVARAILNLHETITRN
jgi:hypothetical protein